MVVRPTKQIAISLWKMFPPLIRDAILHLPLFLERTGIEAGAVVTLGQGLVSLHRQDFYDGIVLAQEGSEKSVNVMSVDNKSHEMWMEKSPAGNVIKMRVGDKVLNLLPLPYLDPESDVRLSKFDESVACFDPEDQRIQSWRKRLEESALSYDENDELNEYLSLGLSSVRRAIEQGLRKDECEISTLVPRNLIYYETLATPPLACDGIGEYIEKSLLPSLNRLPKETRWQRLLLMASHSSISHGLPLEELSEDSAVELFEWLLDNGDRFSQVAGIQIGLVVVERIQAIEPLLVKLITTIRDDDSGELYGRLNLTMNLIAFVEGEISRIGILRDQPVYWRRLVAIAHASVIERELLDLGITSAENTDWDQHGRVHNFFVQSLVDLRAEPRWLPDFLEPKQLHQEFLSRIVDTGMRQNDTIISPELRRLVIEEGADSLRSRLILPFAYLPGPLEGGTQSPTVFPDELIDALRDLPANEVISSEVFASIVNMGLVYQLTPEHAQVVENALRAARYQIEIGESDSQVFSLLVGLAIIAAVTRQRNLANEVKILTRVVRRRPGVDLGASDLMRIGMIAAASEEGVDEWSSLVGEWMSEIAFESMDNKTAAMLRSHLLVMCEIEPKLWKHCSKADAALSAVEGMAA